MTLGLFAEEIKDNVEDGYNYESYTVYVGDHRILTVVTESSKTATKWFKDVHKAYPNTTHGCILAGVCVDQNPSLISYNFNLHRTPSLDETPYHLLQVCIGSHCLLYGLPDRYCDSLQVPKPVQAFFSDPKVVSVGRNISSFAKKLGIDHGIKFSNAVDINALAVKGMKRDDLDLGRYDLDRLAMAVLGKQWDVIRPAKPINWFKDSGGYWDELSLEKVKCATADPYLCHVIGSKLLDMLDGDWYPRNFVKFSNKRIKNKDKQKAKKKC